MTVPARRIAVMVAVVLFGTALGVFLLRSPGGPSSLASAGASEASAPAPVDDLVQIRRAYEAGDDLKRVDSVRRAGQIGSPDAVRWLAEVAEQNQALAAPASAALGEVHNPLAAEDLLQLATGKHPVLVRANAIRALGASGGPECAGALVRLLATDTEVLRIRQESAMTLGRIGGSPGVDGLASTLASLEVDKSGDAEQLRISIVQALGRNPTPAARDALTRHATKDLSASERLFTQNALTAHPTAVQR